MTVFHPIKPLFNEDSRILILGSFPSVKSRESMFFYGHPQNRFWRVISAVFGEKTPQNVEEKINLLLKNNIAVWDVIKSCEISGSSDSSIKNVVPNDISIILNVAKIEKIIVNGKTAEKYYNKYLKNSLNRDAICMPSTSPANAIWKESDLIHEWAKVILEK